MSTTKLFRAGLIATVGIAGLTLSANAQSRYGNVYDYESGRNCGNACAAPAVQAPAGRYGAPIVAAPTYRPAPVYNPAPVYAAPQPAVVYTQPAATYSAPAPTYTQSVQAPPANCPSGTTAQSDGTCMQTSSSSSYSSSTTYSEPSYSSSSSYSSSGETASCPSGTTAQADGTCMQTGSSFSSTSSFSSGSSYSAPSSSYSSDSYSSDSYSSDSYSSYSSSSAPANCPSGTTAQADGTCMQGGSSAFAGTSVEIYSGDATTSASPSYGYGSSSTYTSSDYLPIRK